MEKVNEMVREFMKSEEERRILLEKLEAHCSVILLEYDDEERIMWIQDGIQQLAKRHQQEKLMYEDLEGRQDDVVGRVSFVSGGVTYIQEMTKAQRAYFIGKAMMDWDEEL